MQSELADGVLTLTLNRPQRLNAIDEPTARALLQALRAADADPQVRALLLRGAGRAFCAGRDVSEPPTPEILELVQGVSRAMVECSKPIVCAVHGWVVGAGVEWMLDTDLVVAARSARFKLPEASIGVFVTGGITSVLPRVAGLMRAKALLLLGEEFSAEQAERWGLVSRVVDDASLDDEVRQVAGRLAALDPRVASRFKRVLNQMSLADFAHSIALESQMQTELMAK
ncbi:MAG TPA: enoyl-CoA hydratase-related protein [Burkholderiaceae bacterium]|jgi:2-(1,2-epoxy-1,2-dihydrophenyl)acetyl-CoA isomerase|nr:enoyl-CoA hydratase-related protein [Burkholderiaceae bacterium]